MSAAPRRPAIKLVLFDIDGTLIRTGGAGMHAFERTFQTVFGANGATRGVNFAGRTDTAIVRECLTGLGLPCTAEATERFFQTYVFWLQECLHDLRGSVCPGVGRFLADLTDLTARPAVGLLTGNTRLGAEIKLRHFGLWEQFACGAFGDDDEDRNRLAAVARDRGERLLNTNLNGDEILVVGDTPLDIACARAIGARVLAVATGGFSPRELDQHVPTWTAPTLEHISAAAVCAAG